MLQRVALCIFFLFLAQAVFGRQTGNPITLRLKFKQGQVTKYQATAKLTTTMQAAGLSGPRSSAKTFSTSDRAVEQMKVIRALPDGGAEVTLTTLSDQRTEDGKPQDIQAQKLPSNTITYSPQGMLLALKTSSKSDPINNEVKNALVALQAGSELMPAQPVRPGDSWTQTVHYTALPGIGPVTVQSRFVKIVTVGRYRTALIHSTVTVPLGTLSVPNGEGVQEGGVAKGTFDHYFAIAEGHSIRNIGTGSSAFTVLTRTSKGNPVKFQVKLKIDLTSDLLPG